MDTTTSRRILIGGFGLAAVVAAAPALSTVSPADPHWNGLIATFERAHAKMLAAGKEHDAASEAYQGGRALLGEPPAPPQPPLSIVDMTIAELRAGKFMPTPEQRAQHEADLADWNAREAELDRRTMGGVDERWEASVSEQGKAANAIFRHPAPDIAGLLFKLNLAEREYRGFDLDQAVTAHIFADVRRLVKKEG